MLETSESSEPTQTAFSEPRYSFCFQLEIVPSVSCLFQVSEVKYALSQQPLGSPEAGGGSLPAVPAEASAAASAREHAWARTAGAVKPPRNHSGCPSPAAWSQ